MTRWRARAFPKSSRIYLLVGVSLGTFGHDASAETIAHLTRAIWGCVDPNVAPSINDASNRSHLDPQWIIRTAAEGQCVILPPGGKWANLSDDYNGLTYVAARSTVGRSGSFWVPTSALVVDPPATLRTASPSQAVTKPPPTETSAAQKPKQAAVENSDSESNKKNPTAAILPTPPADVAVPAPSQSTFQSPSSQGNGVGGWVLSTLVALTAFGVLRRPWSRRKRKSNASSETRSNTRPNRTKAVSSVDYVCPSSTPRRIRRRAPRRVRRSETRSVRTHPPQTMPER